MPDSTYGGAHPATRGIDTKALLAIKAHRHELTTHQCKTLRGQVLAGDGDGAMRGLRKILGRGGEKMGGLCLRRRTTNDADAG